MTTDKGKKKQLDEDIVAMAFQHGVSIMWDSYFKQYRVLTRVQILDRTYRFNEFIAAKELTLSNLGRLISDSKSKIYDMYKENNK